MKILVSHLSLAAGLTSVLAAQPYSTWMTDSMIALGVPKVRYYTEATFYRGVENVYNATRDVKYKDFLTAQVDAILNPDGSFVDWGDTSDQLDSIRIGTTLLYVHGITGDEKYRKAADFVKSQLDRQARNPSGGFWHKDPEYPNQMWLDGLYMAAPFYAQYAASYQPGNSSAWDDIVLQFDLIEKHCRDPKTGLLFHGYDESFTKAWADRTTGASPHVWDRAVGWYVMALVDVLDWLPVDHPGHAKLTTYLTTLAAALQKTWDLEGGWWLVMEPPYPGMEGNYIESSGTAMFTYAFLKGVRKGYLEKEAYSPLAEQAYTAILENFVGKNETSGMLTWEGTVKVGSLSGDASYEYYTSQAIIQNHLAGAGAFIFASAEMEATV